MNSIFFDTDIFIVPETESEKLSFPDQTELVVVCNGEDYDSNKDLLHNILKAINYIPGENAVVKPLTQGESIHLAKSLNGQIKYVLCFGVNPKTLCLNAGFRANSLYKTESFSIMLSHSLDQLQANKKYKLALWETLQKAFKS